MNKYNIIEFEDGKFAVQLEKKYLFGLITSVSYLSRSIKGNTWSDPARIELYCKVKTIEDAHNVLELHYKPIQFQTKIKRVVY